MKNITDEQVKELIAVGASIGAHCQPCLTYHVGKAKELGLDAGQIHIAVDVGQMVEKDSMAAMREFTKGVLHAPPQTGSPCCTGQPTPGGKNCCG
jgi:AhpD family alkylhydroperoxidase